MAAPTRKAQQSEQTRAVLVAVARRLFAERGYAGVSAEQVAAEAGVTTGALYHHYRDKRDLFLAVFELVEQELTARVAAAAAAESEPLVQFRAACLCFLDACAEADIRQVLIIDGRSVLGWEQWHEVMARYGLGLTIGALTALVEAGVLRPAPVDALANLLFGALNEGAMYIATSPDPTKARAEVAVALDQVLQGLVSAK